MRGEPGTVAAAVVRGAAPRDMHNLAWPAPGEGFARLGAPEVHKVANPTGVRWVRAVLHAPWERYAASARR